MKTFFRGRRCLASAGLSIVVSLGALLLAPAAHAESDYLNNWRGLYPGSNSDAASCQLCHGSSTGDINPYGFAVASCNPATSGNISQRIQAAEGPNSDGDAGGFTNLEEINASTQPGWTTGLNDIWSRGGCNPQNPETAPNGLGTPLDPPVGNVPPVANDDPYNTPFQTQLIITAPGVLANDTDADGDPLIAVLQSDVTDGALTLIADGSFVYDPNASFSGTDSFTYVANDGTDDSDPATVTITVGAGDADGDGILDDQDNCIDVPNGPVLPDAGGNSQLDTDGDDYGNICDPDLNNDGTINAADLAIFKPLFFTGDPDADFDGNGTVQAADLAIMKRMFFGPPGPSGLAP